MSKEPIFRFPAPSGRIAELTEDQYAALVGAGGLTPSMLLRIAGAALLLEHIDTKDGRSLRQVVQHLHGDPEAGPTNMERRAAVALVASGLVELRGSGSQARYSLVGDPR